jgi:hypothetical protein
MSVLVITGSARQDSHTRRLGEQIVATTPGGVLAPRLTEIPFFDQDLEATPPAAVQRLRAQVADAESVVFVTPEYNAGAEVLETQLSVPEVHVRLDDETLAAELENLLAAFAVEPARAA